MNVFRLSGEERKKKLHIEELSPSLEKALEYFEKRKLVKETLTDHIYRKFN